MKLLIVSLFFFSCIAQAETLYSLEEGIEVFHEYETVVNIESDPSNPDVAFVYKDIVSNYFLTLSNKDYNALVTYILHYYLDHPNDRKWIYELLEFIDNRSTLIQQSQEPDNLAWSAADGIITGAFVLTVVHMGSRLSRAGIFKAGTESLLNRFFGKASIQQILARSRQLGGPSLGRSPRVFQRTQAWISRRLGTTWGQYGAAAFVGGGTGSALYFLRNLEVERYSLRKYLRTINVFILSEAALATCDYYKNQSTFELSSEESLLLLESYSQQLLEIQEMDTHFNRFFEGENIQSDLSTHNEFLKDYMVSQSDSCELGADDRIYPSAVITQIQSMLDSADY